MVTIPSSVERIEEGFCTNRSNIQFQILNKNNKDENNILNAAYCYSIKSSPQLDYYDILFAPENGLVYRQEVSHYIKRIASYSFYNNDLKGGIYFRPNPTLESIGCCSFSRCKLRSICFPSSLIVIEKEAFRYCELCDVEFQYDSKLKEIGDFAFANNKISSISLPSSLVKLGYGSFVYNNIDRVYFNGNSNLEEIGGDLFGVNSLHDFTIPSKVKFLGEKLFSDNSNLNCIELTSTNLPEVERDLYTKIPEKFVIPSHLIFDINNEKWKKYIFKATNIEINNFYNEVNIKYIDNNRFIIGRSTESEVFSVLYYANKEISEVIISSYIKTISSYSFENCMKLKSVTFDDNSKLKVIENSVFANVPIEEISIPSSVCVFKQECFKNTPNLVNIKILNSNVQNVIFFNNSMLIGKRDYNNDDALFDTIHFVRRDSTKIKIPSFVKEISSSSFDSCKKIINIEFEKNSNLEIINDSQFIYLNITRIAIPNNVLSFGNYSFANCKYLKFIDLNDDSKLTSIGDSVFAKSSIKSLFIPSSVAKINWNTFNGLYRFQIFEIGQDSNLKSINYSIFYNNNALLIVPVELSYKVNIYIYIYIYIYINKLI